MRAEKLWKPGTGLSGSLGALGYTCQVSLVGQIEKQWFRGVECLVEATQQTERFGAACRVVITYDPMLLLLTLNVP